MKKSFTAFLIFAILLSFASVTVLESEEDWGFYAHRKLNRLAVFTLPPQMMPLFKSEIEYLSAHAVDPDRRRYATPHEGPRHFIDIDAWGSFPYSNLPRDWNEALGKFSSVSLIDRCIDSDSPDTTVIYFPYIPWDEEVEKEKNSTGEYSDLLELGYRKFIDANVVSNFYSAPWEFQVSQWESMADSLNLTGSDCHFFLVEDQLSNYGILPYYLPIIQSQLTNAMRRGDKSRILRYAADIGHYIGDAHVPLHTTINYNGQLTGQKGIHAFWESRIPELFATEFDLIVGRAQYIENKQDFFWDIILDTHLKVDSVLSIEQHLRDTYPEDAQMCFDQRLSQTVQQPCKEFAEAYEKMMNGMVERQMRKTIFAIGSAWYTAWVDAGQPNLTGEEIVGDDSHLLESDSLRIYYQRGSIYGREHLND
nr:hypothetical protein [Saprospiraceae bacterium]